MVKEATITGTLSKEGSAYHLELSTPVGRYHILMRRSVGDLLQQLDYLPYWKQLALEVVDESGGHPELRAEIVNKAVSDQELPRRYDDQSCRDSDLWRAAKMSLRDVRAELDDVSTELDLFEEIFGRVESNTCRDLEQAKTRAYVPTCCARITSRSREGSRCLKRAIKDMIYKTWGGVEFYLCEAHILEMEERGAIVAYLDYLRKWQEVGYEEATHGMPSQADGRVNPE